MAAVLMGAARMPDPRRVTMWMAGVATLVSTVMVLAVRLPAQGTSRPAPTPVMGEPFTARRVSSSYVKLADGTEISKETESMEARDSRGRTYSKRKLPADGLRKDLPERYIVSTYDPDTRIEARWCTCGKTVAVVHLSEPVHLRPGKAAAGNGTHVQLGPVAEGRLNFHTEELPPQILMGVSTRATKTVRTLPAGVDGNSRELTETIQRWFSPELKLTLLTIIDDPVKGLTKVELKDLKREEPSPELFLTPPGYASQSADDAAR